MGSVVVLEHTPATGVAAFATTLNARATSMPWRTIAVPGGAPLPELDDEVAGILVMGGTMSATRPEAHDWMPAEIDWLHRAVRAEIPVFGVCLGAQLLGQALGGRVERRPRPEVGYLALRRTGAGPDDAVIAGWPDDAAALLVHEDEVVALPPGAVRLLEGSDGAAAWRLGSALAVQFHPEVDAGQLRRWIEASLLDTVFARAGTDPGPLLAEAERRSRFTRAQGRALLGRWLDGPVRERERAAGA
jgi:GMP synthase (glutamine-hydrolysing)